MSKLEKSEVHYSLGHVHSHCGPSFHDDKYYCRHFIPGAGIRGTCSEVAGAIEHTYWCELYAKMKQ